MRIIVTDTALIWNHDNPALEQFKDIVLVVCLDGEPVTDKYECFVSPYKFVGLGMDNFGVESRKYRALEMAADALNKKLHDQKEILFLTDGNPESLYPFYVIKDRNQFCNLHLCAMSPWNFESKRRLIAHKELLSNLFQLKSILYINSNDYLSRLDKRMTMKDLMNKILYDYMELLPRVINGIQGLKEVSYFDFASKSYVSAEKGFNAVDLLKATDEAAEATVSLYSNSAILGFTPLPYYFKEDNRIKEEVERLSVRIDGKKVCNYLREQRIALAKANGISFVSEECPSIGPCAGTCEKCDQESAYLRDKLAEISEAKRQIPNYILTQWEIL